MNGDIPDRPTATDDHAVKSYTLRLEPYAFKASSSTSGEYLEVPLPQDIQQLGWTPTASQSNLGAVTCDLCDDRKFDSRKGAATHLREVHEKSGSGITDEYTTPTAAAEQDSAAENENDSKATELGTRTTTQSVAGLSIPHIQFSPENEAVATVKLRSYTGSMHRCPYAVAVPAAFLQEDSAVESPLAGMTDGDIVNLELDIAAEELRLYAPTDYRIKLGAMDKPPQMSAPVAGVTGSVGHFLQKFTPDTVDIAQYTKYEAQPFRLTLFDPKTLALAKEAARQNQLFWIDPGSKSDSYTKQEAICDPEVLRAVRDRGKLTHASVPLEIRWQETPIQRLQYRRRPLKLLLPKHGKIAFHDLSRPSFTLVELIYTNNDSLNQESNGNWDISAMLVENVDHEIIDIYDVKKFPEDNPYRYSWQSGIDNQRFKEMAKSEMFEKAKRVDRKALQR